MVAPKVTIFLILAVVLGLAMRVESWSYSEQSKWQGMCTTGARQSPVDINFADNTVVYDNALSPIGFRGFKAKVPSGAVTVSNNGKTLVAAVHPSANIRVLGGFFPEAYNIAQLNLHWGAKNNEGSDHSINGKKFPLEVHFVGYRGSSLKAAVASTESDALVELAIMFKIGEANPAIQKLIDAASSAKAGARVPITSDFTLGDLIPFAASTEYITYLGSLSSPPCTQNVNWVVFRNSLTVSKRQLRALRALKSNDGKALSQTFRAAQPLNGRILRSSFPFVVRQSVPSVISTPLGHAVGNVEKVDAPAVGSPDPTAVPSAIPVMDVPTPKVPVKNVVVAANNDQAIGSTSTTYNVSPMDEKNPKGAQKIESVVQSTAAHPVSVAAANFAKRIQEQAQDNAIFASPPTKIPEHIAAMAAQPSPLQALGQTAPDYITDVNYVDSEAELKAKIAEAAAKLTSVSDFAREARASQLAAAGVTEYNGIQYLTAVEVDTPEQVKAQAGLPEQLTSLIEESALSAPIDLAHISATPTQIKAPEPKLAVILDEPINANVTVKLTESQRDAAKKVKKAIEADKTRIHEWAFNTYRVKRAPIIPPNTIEGPYVAEAWSNNTKPNVPTGDKIGLYMQPQPMYNGKYLQKVTSFHASEEKYHDSVEYLEENPKLPDLGFKFPSLDKALKPAPYEVDGTVTSIPNTNEVYVPPTGPLTRSAGSSMLPQNLYPRRSYPVINADIEARKSGFEYAKSKFELTRKDRQYSKIPDDLVAHVKANPRPQAYFGQNTASFAEVDAEVSGEDAFPVVVARPLTFNFGDLKDAVVQEHAAALSSQSARLLAAEAARSDFLRLISNQKTETSPASFSRLYNALRAHVDRTLPSEINDLASFQRARYAAAASKANAHGVPVYAPAAAYSAMVSQAQLFEKARRDAMRRHIAAIARHLKMLERRKVLITRRRRDQAVALGQAALDSAAAVDAATESLTNLPPLDGRIKSLLSAVETMSVEETADQNPTATLESVRAERQQAEAQLNNLLAVRKSLRYAQSQMQAENGHLDAALAESLNNVESLHAHQTAAIDTQAGTVNALASSRNQQAAAQAKAALKTIKSHASASLNAEAAALARLAEIKRQTAAQAAELKAHDERLAAMRAQEAQLKSKLAKATATLAKTEEANKVQGLSLAEEKAKIAKQKKEIKSKMRYIVNASRKLRTTALKLQNEQAQRVRQAISKSLSSTGSSLAAPAKKVSAAQISKDWQAQVDATRKKIASTINALKVEGATDAEIDALANAADI